MARWVAFFMTFLPLLALEPGGAASAEPIVTGTTVTCPASASPRAAGTVLAMGGPPNPATMVKAGAVPVQTGDMMYVPGGYFTMGDHRGRPNEQPPHSVNLCPYYIDIFEVTNASYKEFVDATGRASPTLPAAASVERLGVPGELAPHVASIARRYAWSGGAPPAGTEDNPVVLVNWEDAAAYCAWRGERLPTEAEWEMAARGSDRRAFPWGNEWDAPLTNSAERWAGVEQLAEADGRSWWSGEGAELASRQILTLPVGSFPDGKSPCGLYDVAGNVDEWVADWYNAAYYKEGVEKDPKGPEEGERRVVRGGSWFGVGSGLRVTARRGVHPSVRWVTIGFRCAKHVE